MKKLKKKFNRAANTVEQYMVCVCNTDCLCYCVPSETWSTIQSSGVRNATYHVNTM